MGRSRYHILNEQFPYFHTATVVGWQPGKWWATLRFCTTYLADKRVFAVAPLPELLQLNHPWLQAYFQGPRGRVVPTASLV